MVALVTAVIVEVVLLVPPVITSPTAYPDVLVRVIVPVVLDDTIACASTQVPLISLMVRVNPPPPLFAFAVMVP